MSGYRVSAAGWSSRFSVFRENQSTLKRELQHGPSNWSIAGVVAWLAVRVIPELEAKPEVLQLSWPVLLSCVMALVYHVSIKTLLVAPGH